MQIKSLKTTKPAKNGFTLTSVMVTTAIIGIILPPLLDIALIPIKAQVRSTNFSQAEATATHFAAKATSTNVYDPDLVPDNCDVMELGDQSYTITCKSGQAPLEQRAARSFWVTVSQGSDNLEANGDKPPKEGPYTPGVYCPDFDPDGTLGFDNDHNVNCNPNAWWHHDPAGGPPE